MIPSTLDEAVDALLAQMDSLDRETFLASTDAAYHFNGGMAMRNQWGLWQQGSRLATWFREHGITHADDSSACIYKALRCRLTKRPFDIAVEAEHYREWWAKSEKRHAEGGTQTFLVHRDGRIEFTD